MKRTVLCVALMIAYYKRTVSFYCKAARDRFTEKRKDGARRMRGSGAPAKGALWSVRDLRVRV
jgi:hypothetical protein